MEPKEYYAFISYKREDEKWAKWLQHKLEHYKLPSNLNGRTDLPREIRPVFRDTSELNPGNLPQQIHDALAASRHLIVICSPHSAQSEWVNLEIETFIAMGKQDCIIPFIIEGSPFSKDPSEECFPPAIRNLPKEQEMLGANINEMGRDAAAVKTVAQMFGLHFDTLWQRYGREQKKKLIGGIIFAFIIVAISIFLAFVFRNQKRNLMISQSRFIAEKAELLIDEGDSYLAQLLLLEVLPDGSFDDRPYSMEAEWALRKALKNKGRKLHCSNIACHNIQFTPDDKYVIGMTEDDTLYVWRTDNGKILKKIHLNNYPRKGYDLDDNNYDIFFITNTRFFFVDNSVAYIWDITTGKNVENVSAKLAYEKVKKNSCQSYNVENNKVNAIWDKNHNGTEFVKQNRDSFLIIQNHIGETLEKINVKSPLFAAFSKTPDEILIVKDNHILIWSRLKHRIIFDRAFDSKEFPFSSFWEYKSIYFSQDMTKLVMHMYVHGGRYDSSEFWVLIDLATDSHTIISYSPIEFSSDGTMCLRNTSPYFYDDPDYCIDDFTEINQSYSHVKNSYFNKNAYWWDWCGTYNGQYVFSHIDTTFIIDASSFSLVKKDVKEVCVGISSDKQYYISKDRENQIKVYKNNKIQKTMSLPMATKIEKVEISNDGNKIFIHCDTVMDIEDEDGVHEMVVLNNYQLWDISGKRNKLLCEYLLQDNDNVEYTLAPNGKYVVSTNGEIVDVRSSKKQKLQTVNWTTGLYYPGIRCSHNSKYLVIWNDQEVALWEIDSKRLKWKSTLTNPYAPITDVSFSKDSKELLVTYRYGAILLSVELGKNIDRYETIGDCMDAFYSNEDNHLILITMDGCFDYYHPQLKDLISMVKRNLKDRKLTPDERRKYYLE